MIIGYGFNGPKMTYILQHLCPHYTHVKVKKKSFIETCIQNDIVFDPQFIVSDAAIELSLILLKILFRIVNI
jgi:hypothetical protein